jgi:type III secretion protein J
MRADDRACLRALRAGAKVVLRARSGGWLAALALALAVGCSAPIEHGLDEPAANEVVAALRRGGVAAEKVRDESAGGTGFIVRAPQADTVRALELLRAAGLPRGHRSGFAEVYAQPSLVPTATEERARYVEALSGELQRTLEAVDGVIAARVHLVLAEQDPLAEDGKPRVPAQAAVLLKARAGEPPPIKEPDVQKLVAGSVPGLAPASVAVVILPGAAEASPAPLPYADLGPLRVEASSRPIALLAIALALAVLALLSLLLLYMARRLAEAQRALAGPRQAASATSRTVLSAAGARTSSSTPP